MWTILWIEDGKDRWDRLEYRDDVEEFIRKNGLEEDEDMMIFPPTTDDKWLTPSMMEL